MCQKIGSSEIKYNFNRNHLQLVACSLKIRLFNNTFKKPRKFNHSIKGRTVFQQTPGTATQNVVEH